MELTSRDILLMICFTITHSFVNHIVDSFYDFVNIFQKRDRIWILVFYVIFTLESSTFIKRHICNLSFDVPDWYVFICRRASFRFFTRNQCILHSVSCMVMLKCFIWIRIILVFMLYAIISIFLAHVSFWFHRFQIPH